MHQQDGSGWKLERNESMKRELVNITAERYQEYERQILLRDQLRKEAAGTWLLYMKTFGERMTESFRLKVECIRIKKEIHHIRTTDPYCYIDLLSDENAVQEKIEELQQEIDEYENYRTQLEEMKNQLLETSGLHIIWMMK